MTFPVPPREYWHPGRVTRDIVLVRSERLHVVLCGPEVYPTGSTALVVTRFRAFAEFTRQWETARQVSAFHLDPEDRDGPHLRYRYDPAEPLSEAQPDGHTIRGRTMRLAFWMPGEVPAAAGLSGEFHWPAQSVRVPFAIEGAEVAWALASAERLWAMPEE